MYGHTEFQWKYPSPLEYTNEIINLLGLSRQENGEATNVTWWKNLRHGKIFPNLSVRFSISIPASLLHFERNRKNN